MGGLTVEPDMSGQVSMLLVHPELQSRNKIGVVRAYAVKNTTYAGSKATVSAEYGAIGEIEFAAPLYSTWRTSHCHEASL